MTKRPGKIIRASTIEDIPEPIKKITQKDMIYNHLVKNGKKTQTQLCKEIKAKSNGQVYILLRKLIEEDKIKKITCKCCDSSELYVAI